MKRLRLVVIFILLFIAFLSLSTISNLYLQNNFNSKIRFINDPREISILGLRGAWFTSDKIPYVESFSEYPQFATYLLAVPHLILSYFYAPDYGVAEYGLIFSTLMISFLFFSIVLLYSLRSDNKYFALLMLLPASLYFTYNRFDIMPAFLSILCVKFLSNRKYILSALFLALGGMFKWYLIILFPIFLKFYREREKKFGSAMIFVFLLAAFLAILPTFLAGGIDALMLPYKFHAARGLNKESLFYLLKSLLGSDAWFMVFFFLQFSVAPFVMISRVDSLDKVIKWSTLSILVFMLFAKFYSPQWILWVLPFLILNARVIKDIVPIALFDLATYLCFPVIYDGFPPLLYPIVLIKTAILIYLIVSVSKTKTARQSF